MHPMNGIKINHLQHTQIVEYAPIMNKHQIAEKIGLPYTTVRSYTIKHGIICKGHKKSNVYVNHWEKKELPEGEYFDVETYLKSTSTI